ncbi:MAG: hypothetical protein PHR35_23240 [Kiritimatiellae bacterium]|nr:hypothetical protein [Kiritimatiellia bacterium]
MARYRVRLMDPDGFVRTIEQNAESPTVAKIMAKRSGQVRWYEDVWKVDLIEEQVLLADPCRC